MFFCVFVVTVIVAWSLLVWCRPRSRVRACADVWVVRILKRVPTDRIFSIWLTQLKSVSSSRPLLRLSSLVSSLVHRSGQCHLRPVHNGMNLSSSLSLSSARNNLVYTVVFILTRCWRWKFKIDSCIIHSASSVWKYCSLLLSVVLCCH